MFIHKYVILTVKNRKNLRVVNELGRIGYKLVSVRPVDEGVSEIVMHRRRFRLTERSR